MATQADLDRAYAWAVAQVGKPYVLGGFGDTLDCSTYMSGIATMMRDGVAKRWFTTHPFHGGAFSPIAGWERDLEAPFMIGITDEGVGHTGGTLLGVEFEATAAGNRVVRMGPEARGARDPMYKWVYGFRPSLIGGSQVAEEYTVQPGDLFSAIAAANDVSMDNLAAYNNLLNPGDELIVTQAEPEPDVTTYVAKVGDTWSSIALTHDLSVDELMGLNNIRVAPGSSYIIKKKVEPTVPTDPYANGLPVVDMTDPSAVKLQEELKRVGYLANSVDLADNYGPMTQAAVAAFHNENQQFRTQVYDPQIGQMGWTFLRGMTTGSGRVTSTPENTSGRISADQVLFTSTSNESGKSFAEDTVRTTLALMGLPVTNAWVNGYSTMALRESSYNPNAVNTYDSNAIGQIVSDGHPFQCSRGMWQCIPQTFAQYHQAGTSLSIYDPVASCAASINYVRSRYGVLNDGSNLTDKVQQADPSRPPKGY